MYGLGYPQPASILSDNPALKEWFDDQGRPLEAVSSVEVSISKEGLHVWVCFAWVCFANEPDVLAYHVFAIVR